MRVFHCADIHLDSPFTLFSPKEAESRRIELRSAFTSAIMAAKEYKADIFIISGDLFDGEYVTKDTKELLISEFSKFPECRFFITPGNHDSISGNSFYKTAVLPENVHVFGEKRERIPLDSLNADIYGFGYGQREYRDSPVAGWKIADKSRINILVCHGDMTSQNSDIGPITKEEIADSGFDYIALGHIHKPSGLQNENGVYYCYPGCIEGRGFDELGYKGAMIGTVEKGSVNLKPIRLSKRRYEWINVDLDGCAEKMSALEIIRKEIKQYSDDTALRITLTGEVRQAFSIREKEIGTGPSFPYHIEIQDRTTLVPDIGQLEKENTLKGVFYRRMTQAIEETDKNSEQYEIYSRALKLGLAALDDRNITGISGGDI